MNRSSGSTVRTPSSQRRIKRNRVFYHGGWALSPPSASIDERRYSLTNLIANFPHLIGWKALRIAERPINNLKAGHVRTRVTASHRHEERRSAREFVGQSPWPLCTQVDARFAHHVDDFRMHAFCRLGAGG